MKVFIVLFAIGVVASVSSSPTPELDDAMLEVRQSCPMNQIFSECPACLQICGKKRPKCNRNCKPGCTCPEGSFLSKNGKCVAECGGEDVKEENNEDVTFEVLQNCPFNQIFSECPACLQICGKKRPKCNRNCKPGCTCPEGSFLSKNGKCVAECGGEPTENGEEDATSGISNKCPFNQIFSECPACVQTCGEKRKICNRNCEPGCTCPEGMFFNKKGKCIEKCGGKKKKEKEDEDIEDTPSGISNNCPFNQIFSECPACVQTCGAERKICNRNCEPGCTCPEGMFFNKKGKCIEKCGGKKKKKDEEAEEEDGEEEVGCPYTACTADMLQCASGQLQVNEDGCPLCQCADEESITESPPVTDEVMTEEPMTEEAGRGDELKNEGEFSEETTSTPATCPFNQEYSDCKACDNVCGKRKRCYKNCIAGCACPQDLPYQTKKGKCVAECPKKNGKPKSCPSNQVFSECPACLKRCGKKKAKCNRNCKPGCTCPEDLPYRTKDGECVAECPSNGKKKEKCPKNQEYSECSTPCPLICGQPKPKICAAMCKPGCACPDNKWLREDGKCVKKKQCSTTESKED